MVKGHAHIARSWQGHHKMPSYKLKSKEKSLMKSNLVRMFALVTLATSLSTFAAANDSKQNDASASNQQNDCAVSAKHKKQPKHPKTTEEEQKEKEYDRALLGN
jgi:hypothetical protein